MNSTNPTGGDKPPGLDATQNLAKLETARKNGASWFYWIAGLSLINTALVIFESNVNFILGLGITQVVDVIMRTNGGKTVIFIGLVINLAIAAFLILLGSRARQGAQWAFLLGMVLYAADGCIFLLASDYLGVGFHVFVLFFVYAGYSANTQLKRMAAVASPATGATF